MKDKRLCGWLVYNHDITVTLTFVQVHTLLYLPAISSGFNASTHYNVENPSTVTNHAILELFIGTLCCKTGWKVMWLVLSPTFTTCLATHHVFGNCVNTDF